MVLGKWASRALATAMMAATAVAVFPQQSAQALACPGSLTGGTVTTVGNDCVLQFTTVGSYSWTPPAGITSADVLVVGGGGGGGADAAGGGGAGGYIYEQNYSVSGSISITVGAGGVGGKNSTGTVAANGSNSVFGALTAVGGGKGGTYNGGAGGNGGSSGGGGFVSGVAGTATSGQGTSGGAGGSQWSCACPGGGGGGGAGGVGLNGNTSDGNGGPGVQNSITGTARWYAAGGGGGRWGVVTNVENGGSGIGGRGAGSCGANPATAGTANTGSGGGGAPAGCQTFGSAGGSGIVIVRYSLPDITTPSFVSAALNASGTTLTLTFDEAMSSTVASTGAFTVLVNGQSAAISSVSVSGSAVRLAMTNAVWSGATVTVAYTDPTGADDANAVQDLAGNDNASIPTTSVTNNSTVTTTTTTTTSTVAPSTTAPASLIIDLRTSTTVLAQGQASVATIAPTIAARTTTTLAMSSRQATTTTTSVPAPTTTYVPRPGNVSTGAAAVQVGGKAGDATVTRENNVVVVKMAGAQTQFAGVDGNGNVAPLDSNGNIGLKPGSRVRIRADGFKVGTEVEAWLFSTPRKLGVVKVGAAGDIDATFAIPKDAPTGAHRIAVVARLMNGKEATFTLGIAITNFKKGANVTPWVIGIPLALAMMSGLFLPPALRRRRKTAISE